MRERESKSTCESVLEVDVTFFGAGTFCDVVRFLSQGSLTTLVLEGFPPEVLAAVLEAAFPPGGTLALHLVTCRNHCCLST